MINIGTLMHFAYRPILEIFKEFNWRSFSVLSEQGTRYIEYKTTADNIIKYAKKMDIQ